MKKINGLFLASTIIMLTLWVLIADKGSAFAIEAQLIKILPGGEGHVPSLSLDPQTVNVKKNTIVIWMNGDQKRKVRVLFEKGKSCKDVTVNPNQELPGFLLDSQDCYITELIPYLHSRRLQFPEDGRFTYKVVTEDGEASADGVISVR